MTQEYVRLRKFQGLELMQRRPYTLRKKEQTGRMQERCIIKDIILRRQCGKDRDLL